MTAKKRDIYRTLADEIGFPLCAFCKLHLGGCDGGDCTHPLSAVADWQFETASQLGDCWGFRPRLKLREIADVVGLVKSLGWGVMGYIREADGLITVTGSVDL